ncbi:MAG: hypothetical protein WED34_19090 [Planctomycetales bacterium]
MSRLLPRIILAAVAACSASCCGVSMEQPLSDDATSTIDRRLLGVWQTNSGEVPPRHQLVIAIAKKKDTRNTMEAVFVGVYDDTAKIERTTFYSRPGKMDLLSLADETKDGAGHYYPLRYRFRGEDRLELFVPDLDFVRQAVARSELKGECKEFKFRFRAAPAEPGDETSKEAESDEEKDDKTCGCHLTSSPEEIIGFIEKHGEKCFKKEPMVLQRIVGPDDKQPSDK